MILDSKSNGLFPIDWTKSQIRGAMLGGKTQI